jgi:hypothetical protein
LLGAGEALAVGRQDEYLLCGDKYIFMQLLYLGCKERKLNMKNYAKYIVIAFILIALFWLTGCERKLTSNEQTDVLSFSESTMDNLFAGWESNNYKVFSRDFDAKMREEVSETIFAALKQDIGIKLGNYNSRKVDQVIRSDEYYVIDYQANFEQVESVIITIVFHASNHTIASIALKSEKVSWSTIK